MICKLNITHITLYKYVDEIYISYGIKICDHILHYQLLIPNKMTFDELHRTLSFWKIDSTLFIKSGCQYTSSFLRKIIFRFLCLALTRNKLWNKKMRNKISSSKTWQESKTVIFLPLQENNSLPTECSLLCNITKYSLC